MSVKTMSVKTMLLAVCVVYAALFTACETETGPSLENGGSLPDRLPIPDVPANISENKPIPRSDGGSGWWNNYHQIKITQAGQGGYDVVFIGDSITDYWLTDGAASWQEVNNSVNALNLGVGGDLTSMVIWRLLNGEFPESLKPEYAVLMIGTNHGSHVQNNLSTPENIAAGIGRIIEIINNKSPGTKVILLSVLPREANNQNLRWKINDWINNIIKTYDGHCGVTYFDLGQYYANSDGTLNMELFKDDKLHLSLAGYNLWWEKLQEILN
jgi:lysophospholipase L1-like esterase